MEKQQFPCRFACLVQRWQTGGLRPDLQRYEKSWNAEFDEYIFCIYEQIKPSASLFGISAELSCPAHKGQAQVLPCSNTSDEDTDVPADSL